MWLPYLVVKHIEGDNDGLLTSDAVKWGNFMGISADFVTKVKKSKKAATRIKLPVAIALCFTVPRLQMIG